MDLVSASFFSFSFSAREVSFFCFFSSSSCFFSTSERTDRSLFSICLSYSLMVETYSALFRKSAMLFEAKSVFRREILPSSYMNLILSFIDAYWADSFNFAAARSSFPFSASAASFSICEEASSSSSLKEISSSSRSWISMRRSELFCLSASDVGSA